MSPLILIDGSSYLFRAYYGLPDLRTQDRRPTGAIRGMLNMLLKFQKHYADSPIIIVFDASGKTFRNEMYEQYKANRPPLPDDLRVQIEPVHRLVVAMGFPLIIESGVEADDVIGSLAHVCKQSHRDCIIATADKDMTQLVNQYTKILNPLNFDILDAQAVEDKFGVKPEFITDYLGIVGDQADNIPGVKGIGEKSAVPMLQAFGSLESIYQNIDCIADLDIRGAKSVAEKMCNHREMAFLSKQLATIKLDVPLVIDCLNVGNNLLDEEALQAFFSEYEIRVPQGMFTPTIGVDVNAGVDLEARKTAHLLIDVEDKNLQAQFDFSDLNYQIITKQEDWQKWYQKLSVATLLAFDTETTSLDCQEAEIVGISFALSAGEAIYIPLAHDYFAAPKQLPLQQILEDTKTLLQNPSIAIIGQNLKYDMNVLKRYGIEIKGQGYDSMLESYILNSSASRHDLNTLARKYFNHDCVAYKDITGQGKKQLNFSQVDIDIAGHYAAEDADVCWRLHHFFWPQIEAQPESLKLYNAVEFPLIKVLSHMEMTGTLIDAQELKRQSSELQKGIERLTIQIYEHAGVEFNMSSPAQLQEVLYQRLELPVHKKTPKGQPSTAEDTLHGLVEFHSLPGLILQFRSLSKLKSTYTDKLPKMISAYTGRVHTSYNQTGTVTGRLSSTDPNLQNIPIRTTEGRKVRTAFIAPPNSVIVAADYSQIELRIMAHLSKDTVLLSAFEQRLDVHNATAAEVFEIPINEVTAEQRRRAKAVNFGLIYGMSAFGLAKQLGEGRKEAQEYIDRYFAKYTGVKTFMDKTRETARLNGYVETVFGRRLFLPNIQGGNVMLRKAAERAAINAPMQGTAADIIKKAMIDIDHWLLNHHPDIKLTMQVHDELVFEVPERDVDNICTGIKTRMESVATDRLIVPLEVDVNYGKSWNEAH